MMRLFVALPIREDVRRQIDVGIDKAQSFRADVKWVKEENLHLTIKFLGDQRENLLPGLIDALEQATRLSTGFTLSCTQVGYFPNPQHPRVIWLGLGGQISAADQLAARVDESLAFLGIKPENKRRWHLTLGRLRSERGLEQLLPQLPVIFSPLTGAAWNPEHFSLYQSTLTPRGPIYDELHRFQLGDRSEN